MRLGIRLFVVSCRAGPWPRSEPPKSAAEMIGESAAAACAIGQSPVRIRRGGSPKTPRNGGKFAAGARCGRRVSGPEDYMAVRPVKSEPVSRVNSLISRENTGKFLAIGALGRAETTRFQPLRGPFRAISLDVKQGIFSR